MKLSYDEAVAEAKSGKLVRCEEAAQHWFARWDNGQLWWKNPNTGDERPFDMGRDSVTWSVKK